MEKDKEKLVEEEILELRKQAYSCSQATLVGIARVCGRPMPSEDVLKACSVGLRGGIGKTFDEGSCGALTGAVIALGLMFPEDGGKAADLSHELYDDFKRHFGTVECGRITDEHGKKRCNECCVTAGCKAISLLEA